MEKDSSGRLYLRSQQSHFYQATNAQTKTIREFGVEKHILDISDLYEPNPEEKSADQAAALKYYDNEDERSRHNDIEIVETDYDNGAKKTKIITQVRKISLNRSMQTEDRTPTQEPPKKTHRKRKFQKKRN